MRTFYVSQAFLNLHAASVISHARAAENAFSEGDTTRSQGSCSRLACLRLALDLLG